MCESRVILREGDKEEEIMKETAMIDIKPDSIVVSDILGNSKKLENCELERIDFVKHEVVLRKKKQ